ncbi:MAG: glycosyltransferase family 4 protein [Halieaceae bacterium]|nr:glycosyltransferase family 4 protein [Halieaceae bacterium]
MTEPLKIALTSYRSQPFSGGQGVYVSALSKALIEQGMQVDVISGPPYPNLDERVGLIKLPSMDLYENGLRSLRRHHLRSLSNIVEWLSKLTGGFAEPYTFGRRLRRHFATFKPEYDLVHDNQSLCYGLLDVERLGYPIVATIHHPISSDLRLALQAEPVWWRRLFLRRWHSFLRMQIPVAQQVKRIFAVSESARKDVEREFGIDPARMVVTGIGTDTDLFKPLPGRIKDANRIMITASSDTALKGVVYAVQAFAMLREQFPDLRLRLIGKLKPEGEAQKLINRLDLASAIDNHSRVSQEDLVAFYNEASVFVSPSLYEGFGLPAAEAMASGTAVVVTKGGALPEVVGQDGIVVPAGDSQALAVAVADLLQDPGHRAALEQRGRDRIVNEFSWAASARRTINEYKAILANADR